MNIRVIPALGVMAVCAVLTAESAEAQDRALVERGVKVYAAQKCNVCHSIAGIGQKKGPLDEVGSKLTEDEIRQWIVNAPEMTRKTKSTRKPVMKNYPHLPKDDVDGLVAYLATLKKS